MISISNRPPLVCPLAHMPRTVSTSLFQANKAVALPQARSELLLLIVHLASVMLRLIGKSAE